jgi:predicted porin
MKKKALACAALAPFTLLVQQAYAQSSVALYGIIDEGLNYTTNVQAAGSPRRTGGHLVNLSTGVVQGSRFGLRGTEDLGGGLKAIFVLENGFDVNTGKLGQGGLMFGRQAYVGVASSYGTVTAGRQYDSVVDYVGPFEAAATWAGNIGAHPGDVDNFNNANRVNNTVKYTSATYGGFRLGGMYSLGGVAGDTTRNQLWSVGATYTDAALSLGVGYLNARNPNLSFFGTTGSAGGATTNNLGATTLTGVQGNPVISGYASAHSEEIFGAGAAYTIGGATLGATYSNIRFSNLGDTQSGPNPFGYRGAAVFNDAEVNFKYFFTPVLQAAVAYNFLKNNGSDGSSGAKYHQVDLGVDYFLSKRTDVYLLGILQKATGHDSTGQVAVASVNTLTPSNTDKIAVVRIGIRHKF